MKAQISRIKSTAILIGYNPQGDCVYSEIISVDDYYDGIHAWDDSATVRNIRLRRLKCYLFDLDGTLFQESETHFDMKTGVYSSGWIRHADGTVTGDKPLE